MPQNLTRLVDALIARVQSEQPAGVYVLHMPLGVALQLPGMRTGFIDPYFTDTGEVAAIRANTYAGLEVVSWPGAETAEKVTASPLLAAGAPSAPVYVLDLLSGEITRR